MEMVALVKPIAILVIFVIFECFNEKSNLALILKHPLYCFIILLNNDRDFKY